MRLTAYLVVVFIATWALWFTAFAMPTSWFRTVIFFAGVFSPGIVALAWTHFEQGAAGIRDLLRRLVKVDVGAGWFVFALFFTAAVKLLAALIVRAGTGTWPAFGSQPIPLMFAAAVFATLAGGQAGEEIGWRGFALPRLARTIGPGAASLALGVVWAVWHLPLFFVGGGDTMGQSFPFYVLQVTGLSVVITWVYVKTGGSLFVTMLLHAAINNTKDIVPSAVPGAANPWALHASPVGGVSLAILWLCAAWFLIDMRHMGRGAWDAGREKGL